MFQQRVFSGLRSFRVLKNQKLFGVGRNGCGELGTGDKENRNEFVEIKLPQGAEIVMFHGRFSSDATIVLTTLGFMGTGCGGEGVFGDGTTGDRCKLSPMGYKGKKIDKYFAEGGALWVFLDSGTIMRSGFNTHGGLGDGSTVDILLPEELKLNFLSQKQEGIVHLSAVYHTALMSDRGRVYVSGRGSNGQLGLSHWKNISLFTKVTFFDHEKFVTQVVSGSYHLIFVTKNFCIYSCGRNSFGELGLGDQGDRFTPTRIAGFGGKGKLKVKKVSAGVSHTLVLTKDHEVFSFGKNSECQCGFDSQLNLIFVPTLVKTSFKVVDFELCAYSSVFVGGNGLLRSVGRNAEGQAALGHFTSPVRKMSRTRMKIELKLIEGTFPTCPMVNGLWNDTYYQNIVVYCKTYSRSDLY